MTEHARPGGAYEAGWTELLHKTERTRVTRLFLAERTFIRNEPLGPDAQRRLRHELAMLERLRGAVGVAQLLEEPRYRGRSCCRGVSLAELSKRLNVDELIGLAVRLARAVAGMHRRGVTHRDVTPANIVLSGDGGSCLVDFALATSLAEVRPEFSHHTQIVGTLAYLAPEQTGRTDRSVDQCADLYASGATSYELAMGAPPSGSGDPLRLTHDHLAGVALPPARLYQAVPGRSRRSSCICWRRSQTTGTRSWTDWPRRLYFPVRPGRNYYCDRVEVPCGIAIRVARAALCAGLAAALSMVSASKLFSRRRRSYA